MVTVALALGAAVGWGISDFLGGRKSRTAPLLSVLLISQGTALVAVAVLVVVRGNGLLSGGQLLWGVAAGAGEAIAIAALYRGLSVGTMSIVAPVAATAPVVPVVAGLVAGQPLGLSQGLGLGLAVVGLVITSMQPRTGSVSVGPSIAYGLLAAVGFGTFFLALDRASEHAVAPALLTAKLTSVAIIAALVLGWAARGERFGIRRTDLPLIVGIGLLLVTADASYATATTHGLAGIAAVVGSLHTVVTMTLARLWLHERLARIQQIGIVTSLSGVLVLAAS
ncbi:DMT family transporter [Kribbella turkmenica]|uniref:DMT family transporter n=1 Tax=Kribbella turkmenica TaxID=2530375 RepID=A0A4R4XGA8_9ACTN|nr:DMT family transporter [Kribbella turkmenica]TDD29836.1 DMT family transporter [Kribbella turkmenica]